MSEFERKPGANPADYFFLLRVYRSLHAGKFTAVVVNFNFNWNFNRFELINKWLLKLATVIIYSDSSLLTNTKNRSLPFFSHLRSLTL